MGNVFRADDWFELCVVLGEFGSRCRHRACVGPVCQGHSLTTPNAGTGVAVRIVITRSRGRRRALAIPVFQSTRHPHVTARRTVAAFVVGALVSAQGIGNGTDHETQANQSGRREVERGSIRHSARVADVALMNTGRNEGMLGALVHSPLTSFFNVLMS